MTLKEKLLRAWRGDPEPPFDPDRPPDRPLTRHELDQVVERVSEDAPEERPGVSPSDVGPPLVDAEPLRYGLGAPAAGTVAA